MSTLLTIPPLDWWQNHMRKTLKIHLNKKMYNGRFTIHYYMGGGLGGETSFYLLGDARYELWSTVTRGHERKIYSGQLLVSHVEQVVQEMLAVKIWRVRHDPSTRLDDAKVMVSVKARGQKSIVMLWGSEIRESLPFIAIQRSLLALICQISKGEVLEQPRDINELALQVDRGGRFRQQFHLLASLIKRVKTRSYELPSHLRQPRETRER